MILIDENLDEDFPATLGPYEVRHVVGMGWQGTKNGKLLQMAAEAGFAAFITADKNMPYQQSMRGRPFALFVLDIHPNTIFTQTACIPAILDLLPTMEPGRVYVIEGPRPKRERRSSL